MCSGCLRQYITTSCDISDVNTQASLLARNSSAGAETHVVFCPFSDVAGGGSTVVACGHPFSLSQLCLGLDGADAAVVVDGVILRAIAWCVSRRAEARALARAAEAATASAASRHEDEATVDVQEERAGRATMAIERERDVAMFRAIIPRAYQCARCGLGPVEHANCNDLAAHHGQHLIARRQVCRTRGFVVGSDRVNNACARCGWFSANISDWHAWDGRLPDDWTVAASTAPAAIAGTGGRVYGSRARFCDLFGRALARGCWQNLGTAQTGTYVLAGIMAGMALTAGGARFLCVLCYVLVRFLCVLCYVLVRLVAAVLCALVRVFAGIMAAEWEFLRFWLSSTKPGK